MRRATIAGVVGFAMLGAASGAAAATTIGQLPPNDIDPTNCTPQTSFLNTAVDSGPDYTTPAGVVTSFSTSAGSGSDGTTARLKVYRATADASKYTVVGRTALFPMVGGPSGGPGQVNTFDTGVRIPVQDGDYVSILTGGEGGPCQFQPAGGTPANDTYVVHQSGDAAPGASEGFLGPFTGTRANVQAMVEADADGDGFGDDTQDQCPGQAGPANGCDVDPPQTTITKAPPNRIATKRKRARVRFAFVSDEAGSTFQCSLGGARFAPCDSPLVLKLKATRPATRYELSVRAVDPAGNKDRTPARASVTIKRKS